MARVRVNYGSGEKAIAKAAAKKLDVPCWSWTRKVAASHWGPARTEKGFYVGHMLPDLLSRENVISSEV